MHLRGTNSHKTVVLTLRGINSSFLCRADDLLDILLSTRLLLIVILFLLIGVTVCEELTFLVPC